MKCDEGIVFKHSSVAKNMLDVIYIWNMVIHSFWTYPFSTYYVPDTLLDISDTIMSK